MNKLFSADGLLALEDRSPLGEALLVSAVLWVS